ncbi:Outer membrane efflux protein [Verrucomicrobia bacterium]|nr:Outer membrane efflux protein [Verrucomicrobiota bacterium]
MKKLMIAALAGLAVSPTFADNLPSLTLKEAHETALHNHPLISVADLKALASREAFKQVRAGYLPNLSANAVAVGTAENNTRLEAVGALNSPHIFDREAEGLVLSQLITDFGRTANLIGSAKLQAEAAANNAQATREQILLLVDGAFYSAQRAEAVTKVAQQTLSSRQIFLDQVTALASNKLRSELDVSFAKVNTEDAQLLLIQAQNDLDAAFTQLANLLGFRETKSYSLIEEPLPPPVSTNASDFVQQALNARPDLLSLRNQQQGSLKLAHAERDARLPSISAVGAAGLAPVHDSTLGDNYAAGGLVISMPLFAGGLYVARQHEAELQAQAAAEGLRDLEDNIIRDVRVAWLNARTGFERYHVTGQLLETAKQSYELAQARYQNGISSIVEFYQAELNLVSAEISYATAQYDYLVQRSALNYQTGSLR